MYGFYAKFLIQCWRKSIQVKEKLCSLVFGDRRRMPSGGCYFVSRFFVALCHVPLSVFMLLDFSKQLFFWFQRPYTYRQSFLWIFLTFSELAHHLYRKDSMLTSIFHCVYWYKTNKSNRRTWTNAGSSAFRVFIVSDLPG